ncbi:MAG TPA: ABC transporter substrate-binding protein [Stellaceae bacterium]|nr:ABC transporter substrate-binding protein [Stellaceae bacterium]
MQRNALRSTVSILFLLALGAAPISLPASAATSLLVGRSNPIADAELPAEVGFELGFFEKHDLDVKFVDLTGGSRLIQAMTAGSVGIGVSAATGMALVAKGAPILAVCENTATLPYFAIGVPWDSPLHTLAELEGKKIAVSAVASLTDWLAQELARKEGWPPDSISRVAIGGNPVALAAAFRGHLVDAYIGGTIDFQEMGEKKIGRLLAPVSTYMGKVASGAIYASDDMMKTAPDTIRAFLAAWVETTAYISSHKTETVKIESAFSGYSQSLIAREYDIDQGMFTTDCRFDAESIEALKQSFIELKLLSTPPDMSKLYTNAFLQEN